MRHFSLLISLAGVVLPWGSQAQAPAAPAPARHAPTRAGTIGGRVTLADGQPADHVLVLLKGTRRGTTPDAEGSFRLAAPAGRQLLTVAGLGYVTQEILVEVLAGQVVMVPTLTLARGEQPLTEVTVTGTKTLNQRATSVGKLPVAPLDLPQASLTVERQVLEQQQVLHLSDVLVNTPGVYVMGTTGGTQEEIASRGFAYTSNNTLKNGVRYNNAILPEASALERLEVLKGSAAILYGNVAAGGVLNLVTKKPRFERGGSVGQLRAGKTQLRPVRGLGPGPSGGISAEWLLRAGRQLPRPGEQQPLLRQPVAAFQPQPHHHAAAGRRFFARPPYAGLRHRGH